jgi:endogenous inhibitor of DNA gyrase (YacG/DUF329 family)
MSPTEPKGRCKNCSKPLDLSEENIKYAPFCGKKCQMADLGKWFDEKYVISNRESGLSSEDLEELERELDENDE